ncbi:hypothetical protein BDB00DRAFT_854759 [Zychaea mexicana]|uniref:uncharacterized protein n=1 Tax=Zychaea mexicana TaxID=64656 RepID=UPI0022FE9B5E|nr:uncharacterized protein BDB00DRAFT_854759 [Zychaea mexicana]KAI9484569.1 hypothetical protein BDB00DRAFT_854759 [Zychaea mexicana]
MHGLSTLLTLGYKTIKHGAPIVLRVVKGLNSVHWPVAKGILFKKPGRGSQHFGLYLMHISHMVHGPSLERPKDSLDLATENDPPCKPITSQSLMR